MKLLPQQYCFSDFCQSLLSPYFFFSPILFRGLKKGRRFFGLSVYGCFLVTSNASTAPMITMTIMIATIPYSRVVFEAKLVAGVVVGGVVAAGGMTVKLVVSCDGQ